MTNKALPTDIQEVINTDNMVNYFDGDNWIEHAPGIVSFQNIGDGARYIKDVEEMVTNQRLSWQAKDQKKIAEDYGRKAMDTMYIRNIRKNENFDDKNPSQEVKDHDRLFERFEKDFDIRYEKAFIQAYNDMNYNISMV